MSKNKEILPETKVGLAKEKRISLRAEFNVDAFVVSNDKLEQILDYTNDTNIFSLILFFFSLAITCIITLFTANINNYIFNGLIAIASISLTVGIVKIQAHRKQRKRIHQIICAIKKYRCRLE